MSTMTIESLEGIDLDSVPPCQIMITIGTSRGRCGKPSAYRIIGRCPEHGKQTAFICEACFEYSRQVGLWHADCTIPVTVEII